MAKFLGHKEWKKHKARADFKLFVKQCHPTVRLSKTVRLLRRDVRVLHTIQRLQGKRFL